MQITPLEAIEKTMQLHIEEKAICAPWQSFREEELWTREVNLAFEANHEGLRTLYKLYSKPLFNKVSME